MSGRGCVAIESGKRVPTDSTPRRGFIDGWAVNGREGEAQKRSGSGLPAGMRGRGCNLAGEARSELIKGNFPRMLHLLGEGSAPPTPRHQRSILYMEIQEHPTRPQDETKTRWEKPLLNPQH